MVQPLHSIKTMPTLGRLASCNVTMYAADHQPPHFHVRARDGREALIVISNLAILSGPLGKRELSEALDWAAAHQTLLLARWKELNP